MIKRPRVVVNNEKLHTANTHTHTLALGTVDVGDVDAAATRGLAELLPTAHERETGRSTQTDRYVQRVCGECEHVRLAGTADLLPALHNNIVDVFGGWGWWWWSWVSMRGRGIGMRR